jgi:DNA polymerase I-like protein with 3'-5' exonuclease and polymerase domains
VLISLDIETKALDESVEDAALHPHLSQITVVGLWCPEFSFVTRDLKELARFIKDNPSYSYLGHNFQFDLRHLHYHGVDIPLEQWAHDTSLMASACTTKISDSWLEAYEKKRLEKNKELKRGAIHRKAGRRSLKTLAPHFLSIPPFWETPENHDNDDYVLKDCEYTYKLYEFFLEEMKSDGTLSFYTDWLMPKAKLFQQAIHRGIKVDTQTMNYEWYRAQDEKGTLRGQLDDKWKDAYEAYRTILRQELELKYDEKVKAALEKAKDKKKCEARYQKLKEKALEKVPFELNLDSPKQLLWLLRDHFKYDVNTFNGSESTGKEVLQKLGEKHEDIQLFLKYRAANKLCSSFFPTYERLLYPDGCLRASFNLDGARTGRLSSAQPNLQQVPGDLHKLFVARPGYKLLCYDESAIEPRLIAYLTEDPILCDLMINDGDFHSANAVIMFGLSCPESDVKELHPHERKVAKEVGLALFYGASARRIQQSAQKYGFFWTYEQCKEIFQNFKEAYHYTFKFKKELDRRAEKGEAIVNLFGRKHIYPNQDDIFMKTFNTLIQSSASDLLIDSQYKAAVEYKKMGLDAHFLLSVHDEAIVEAREDQVAQVQKIMIEQMTAYPLNTPLGQIPLKVEGSVADHWSK